MTRSPSSTFLAAILAAVLSTAMLPGIARAHEGPGGLGKVEFKVDCKGEAQLAFNRAMALYHSFDWRRAKGAFEQVLAADPACGMGHWGLAMTRLDNPYIWPGNLLPAVIVDVTASLDAARKAGLKSQRDKDYVEAVAVFVKDTDKVAFRPRLQAFDAAMTKLAQTHKDDVEAQILAALITSANFDPTDKTYANQLRAAKALDPLFLKLPQHPGVAHYLIHSYDYPPIAKHGIEAAKRYAAIAPDAPHALHMPGHIFTRVGMWKESIAANRASAKAAGDVTFDGHHANDYLVYAHLQLAQDKAALAPMESSRKLKLIDHFGSAYAYAAMPARYALERSDWKTAATTPLVPAADAYPWKKYPQAEAVNAFARGVGAARGGNPAAAKTEIERLKALKAAATELKLAYWADQIDIQSEIVRGLVANAEGNWKDAVLILRAAADREDKTEKHAVTPGPLLPAREILGEVMMEQTTGGEALSEFEAVMIKEPNRYRAILGAARAAMKSGDGNLARQYFRQLVELGKGADTQRFGLSQARRLVAAK